MALFYASRGVTATGQTVGDQAMTRFDLLDEYTSVVSPGRGPRRCKMLEAEPRDYTSCFKVLIVLAFGGGLLLASLHHGPITNDSVSAMQVAAQNDPSH